MPIYKYPFVLVYSAHKSSCWFQKWVDEREKNSACVHGCVCVCERERVCVCEWERESFKSSSTLKHSKLGPSPSIDASRERTGKSRGCFWWNLGRGGLRYGTGTKEAKSTFLLLKLLLLISPTQEVPNSFSWNTLSLSQTRSHARSHTFSLFLHLAYILERQEPNEYTSWLQNELKILKPFLADVTRGAIRPRQPHPRGPPKNGSPSPFLYPKLIRSAAPLKFFSALPKAFWAIDTMPTHGRGGGGRVRERPRGGGGKKS